MKNIRQRVVAFVAGVLLGPVVAWGGLEAGTYISDLVATNPLGSDLASTLDDHIRLVKSTIKTTFPNINGAVTVTDEQLNAVATNVAANPTGTIGLTAVNGTATTYLRSDGAPALSQAIAPTWTARHTFTNLGGVGGAVLVSSSVPLLALQETDAAANNQYWQIFAQGEQFAIGAVNDANSASSAIMTVDRTGTTVDRVAFPSDNATGNVFVVGPVGSLTPEFAFRSANRGALAVSNTSGVAATVNVMSVHNENTAGDNAFIEFRTEGGTGTARGSIDYNRAGGAVRYNTTSDARLKKNFKPAPSARNVVDCIQIESFDWRESGVHVEHGVVAQRLNKCAPYAVSKGDVWQVDKSTLIPALIKYVQEQDARIARLEADAARRH